MPRFGMSGLLIAALLVLPADSRGAASEATLSIEPEAAQTLKSALERIEGARSFTYRAEITNETPLPSGQKIQFAGTLEVAVRRPNGLWSSFDGDQRSTRSWYDGKTFTLLNIGKNVYARWPAPQELEALIGAMKDTIGFTPPLSPLLREGVTTNALTNVTSGFTVGRTVIDAVPCRHLAFRGERTDWQVWVSETGEPVLKRIVIAYREEPTAPQYAATFLAWDFAPRLPDSVFGFTPPPGAIQGEFETVKR